MVSPDRLTKARMARIGDVVKVTVRKHDPSQEEDPYYVTYDVPYSREMRILEALDYIVEELGESIAYQWYCGVIKCGMCGVMANGRPVLACWEPIGGDITVEPLSKFPVIRDLVVDRSRYESEVAKLQPWLIRKDPYPGFPEKVRPREMDVAVELTHCVECLLCTSACPSYSSDSEFSGPAALVQLARVAFDPRDAGQREDVMRSTGVASCEDCCVCTEVCPVDIKIRDHVIEPMRRLVNEASVEGRGEA